MSDVICRLSRRRQNKTPRFSWTLWVLLWPRFSWTLWVLPCERVNNYSYVLKRFIDNRPKRFSGLPSWGRETVLIQIHSKLNLRTNIKKFKKAIDAGHACAHTRSLTVSSEAWTLGTGTTGTLLRRPASSTSSFPPLTLQRRLTEAPSPAPKNKVVPVWIHRLMVPVISCCRRALMTSHDDILHSLFFISEFKNKIKIKCDGDCLFLLSTYFNNEATVAHRSQNTVQMSAHSNPVLTDPGYSAELRVWLTGTWRRGVGPQDLQGPDEEERWDHGNSRKTRDAQSVHSITGSGLFFQTQWKTSGGFSMFLISV